MMLATLALAGLTAAVRADSVDQSQLVNNAYMANFSQTNLAQSFQQANDNITGASVLLQANLGAGAGDVTITLYNALPNNGGSVLASGTAFGVLDGQLPSTSPKPA